MPDLIEGYARAIQETAGAEEQLDRVGDELFRLARAIETSPELRETLTDPRLSYDRKTAIIGDLLEGRAAPLTIHLVNLVVGAGRARELPAIADRLVENVAADRDRAVAEVRTAVPLDSFTIERLAAALSRKTGKRVEVKVVVDPDVVGGVVARIGETVIDGSVRSRLDSLRSAMQSGAKG